MKEKGTKIKNLYTKQISKLGKGLSENQIQHALKTKTQEEVDKLHNELVLQSSSYQMVSIRKNEALEKIVRENIHLVEKPAQKIYLKETDWNILLEKANIKTNISQLPIWVSSEICFCVFMLVTDEIYQELVNYQETEKLNRELP